MQTVFGEEREQLQDLIVDGTIILKMILNTYVGGGGVQDRHERRTLLNTKIKIIHRATKYEDFLHCVDKRHPLERISARRSQ
jgi:hypothetical protein